MLRMTYASFMRFYEKVDMKMIRSIWSPWRNETGAMATNSKMMPLQHFDPGNLSEIPMQTRSVRMCGTRKRWGVIPEFGITPPSCMTCSRPLLLHRYVRELPETICCCDIIFGFVAVAPVLFRHGDQMLLIFFMSTFS